MRFFQRAAAVVKSMWTEDEISPEDREKILRRGGRGILLGALKDGLLIAAIFPVVLSGYEYLWGSRVWIGWPRVLFSFLSAFAAFTLLSAGERCHTYRRCRKMRDAAPPDGASAALEETNPQAPPDEPDGS